MHHAEHSQWNSLADALFAKLPRWRQPSGLRASARSPRERYVRRTVLRFLMANYVIGRDGAGNERRVEGPTSV